MWQILECRIKILSADKSAKGSIMTYIKEKNQDPIC